VPAETVVRYLAELPATWENAGSGRGRQLLASALFDRIEVLGLRETTVHLSDHAVRHGLAAALPAQLELPVYGRGERFRPNHRLVQRLEKGWAESQQPGVPPAD
jgi:hypothetical protein